MHFTRHPEGDWDTAPSTYGMDLDGDDILELIEETLAVTQDNTMSARDRLMCEVAHTFWDDDLYIVLYNVDQGYGGPEEGGWYFPVYTKKGAWKIEADNWPDRLAMLKTALPIYEAYYKAQEWGTYGSMGGWEEFVLMPEVVPQGDQPGLAETKSTPSYC